MEKVARMYFLPRELLERFYRLHTRIINEVRWKNVRVTMNDLMILIISKGLDILEKTETEEIVKWLEKKK